MLLLVQKADTWLKQNMSSCFVNSFLLRRENPHSRWSTRVGQRLIFLMLIIRSVHDDVMKWKHFPRYWLFVRGTHRSPVNFPHKGQWRGALMFSLICVWINGWVKNCEAGDLRRIRTHHDVQTEMRFGVEQLLFTKPIHCKQGLFYSKSHFSLHDGVKQQRHFMWFHKHKIELKYV